MNQEKIQQAMNTVEHARALSHKIHDIKILIETLEQTINPNTGLVKDTGKLTMRIQNTVNPKQGNIIVFSEFRLPKEGLNIPVDADLIPVLHKYFTEKQKQKQAELNSIRWD